MVSFILTLFTDYGYGNEFSSIAFKSSKENGTQFYWGAVIIYAG